MQYFSSMSSIHRSPKSPQKRRQPDQSEPQGRIPWLKIEGITFDTVLTIHNNNNNNDNINNYNNNTLYLIAPTIGTQGHLLSYKTSNKTYNKQQIIRKKTLIQLTETFNSEKRFSSTAAQQSIKR